MFYMCTVDKMKVLRKGSGEMKRVVIAAFASVLLLLSLFSFSLSNSVQAQDLDLMGWIGYVFKGTDAFYGENVVAFEEYSTALLAVTVTNNLTLQMNVSAVGISLDWPASGGNSTLASRSDPVKMHPGEIRAFTIGFTVPSAIAVSNLFLHEYKIYVEHVNASDGTGVVVNTTTIYRYQLPGTKYFFAVYSSAQADAQELSQRLVGMPTAAFFRSSRAKSLVYQAENETRVGNQDYRGGDFASAKTHYNASLALYNGAYAAEETYSVTLEDIDLRNRSLTVNLTEVTIRLLEAQIKNVESWASMVYSFGVTLTLFGVATVLFAFGYIIKQLAALKKAGQAPTE